MAEQKAIMVYGNIQPPLTKKQFHGTTYLEYGIPKKLEKELTKMMNKRLKEFYKECNCESCKRRRKNK